MCFSIMHTVARLWLKWCIFLLLIDYTSGKWGNKYNDNSNGTYSGVVVSRSLGQMMKCPEFMNLGVYILINGLISNW